MGGCQQVTGEKDAVCPPLRIPARLVEPSTGPCCPPPAGRRHAALPPGEAHPGHRSCICHSVTLDNMRQTAWGPVGWRRLREERTFWAIGEVAWRRRNLTGFLKCKQDVDRWRSPGQVVDVGTGTGGLAWDEPLGREEARQTTLGKLSWAAGEWMGSIGGTTGGKPRYLMTWGQEGGLKPGWVGAGWGWQMDRRTELTRPAGVFEAPSERGPEVRRPA